MAFVVCSQCLGLYSTQTNKVFRIVRITNQSDGMNTTHKGKTKKGSNNKKYSTLHLPMKNMPLGRAVQILA